MKNLAHLASQWGVALLEGEHPLEGSRSPDTSGEYDSALRESEGGLVDQRRSLQQGTYSPWCHRW